jgi:hydrogenase expression/formation protein HypE
MARRPAALAEGKLPREKLSRLLRFTAAGSPEIIVGAETGEDAAVVRGAGQIVVTTDPITFTEQHIGTYTVAVNCNDIVAMGGRPAYLTTTILLPPGTSEARLRTVFRELAEAAERAGVLWVGGHTEVTSAVNRIVVSAQGIGTLKRKPTCSSEARPGELLVMTKWAALEATTLLARERKGEARELLGAKAFREVLRWLQDPGISIVKEGRILETYPLGAAHDPTEGGVATGIREVIIRSRVGARIYRERIPVRPETRLLFRHYGLDPLGALSSGTFLFTARPQVAERACRELERQGIPAAIIGEINGRAGRVELVEGRESRPLPEFPRDELLRLGV